FFSDINCSFFPSFGLVLIYSIWYASSVVIQLIIYIWILLISILGWIDFDLCPNIFALLLTTVGPNFFCSLLLNKSNIFPLFPYFFSIKFSIAFFFALGTESPSDGHFPPGSKTSCTVSSTAPVLRKRDPFDNSVDRTPSTDGSSATTARKRSPLGGNDRKTGPAIFRKLDHKKPSDWKVQIVSDSSGITVSEDNPLNRGERVLKTVEEERNKFTNPEIKGALFNENSDEKKQKFGIFKPGSLVMPCDDKNFVVGNETGELCRHQRECEDLSLIRKQLVQIENQQSNLLDILQKFIGSSHIGMRSLETRVHGLELALDEISFDLAVSTGRMSRNAAGATCCKLPGAEFLSSKLWKKRVGRFSTSPFSIFDGNASAAGVYRIPDKNGDPEVFKLENRRYRLQGDRGFIVNPLAEIPRRSLQIPEVSEMGAARNIAA
ncbi:TORTIFOLIA1-like protein 3, partial [Olea europaea var. sylvestris]|uniref:TORTIFOLIA1-like protein 3 n=1 Tax=Olea europaea var. sylvestris TaxID=158386 RepID=UPI000C1D4F18